MKNKSLTAFLFFLLLGCCVAILALCGCAHAPEPVYRVQYAKAGDRLFVNVLSRQQIMSGNKPTSTTLYLYTVKGRYDTKIFYVSSWNAYNVGTEQELSEDDSIEGSY